jgi:hypothetical protein
MTFKAVEWVRSVRDEPCRLTKNMSAEELAQFYRQRAEVVVKALAEVKKQPSLKPQ